MTPESTEPGTGPTLTPDPAPARLDPVDRPPDPSPAFERAWRLALDLERALHGSPAIAPVHPAPLLVAEVAVRSAPEDVPHDLIPYARAARSAAGHDWQLTADAMAIGPRTVVRRFAEWRAGWVRAWDLDHASTVRSLVTRSRGLGATDLGMLGAAVDGAEVELDGSAQRDLLAACDDARRAIASADATGVGFVDATPGSPAIGLRRTWSPAAGVELLATGRRLGAWMHPTVGLCIGVDGHDESSVMLRGVTEVEFVDDGARIIAGLEHTVVDDAAARPLAWLVPAATRWRVRPIPEVVVWARTLVRLHEAVAYADALDRPVTIRPASRFMAEWPEPRPI